MVGGGRVRPTVLHRTFIASPGVLHRDAVASEGQICGVTNSRRRHTGKAREHVMRTTEMMNTYPAEISVDRDLLARTIDMLVACAQACTSCADACLSEETVTEL